jgi:hypothetical protein
LVFKIPRNFERDLTLRIIASKTRQELASTLILALLPFHDQALVLTRLNVVWVGR